MTAKSRVNTTPNGARGVFDLGELRTDKARDEALRDGTDLANSAFFAQRARGRLLFAYSLNAWLHYDGARWTPDRSGTVARLAKEVALELLHFAANLKGDEQRTSAVKKAMALQNRRRLDAMIALAQPELPVLSEALNADPEVLNVTNGTIDLRTGHLRPHDPRDLITKLAPVAYDAGATAERWKLFVREIFRDDDRLVEYLQKFVGMCLAGVVIEHQIVILHGSGANGKTTLLEILKALLGDYGVVVDPSLFLAKRDAKGPSPELVRLHGARLVTASELPEGGRLSENVVKRMTGGDRIATRDLYTGVIEFDPTWKIAIATNHAPTIRDTSEAMWRRMHLVPFEAIFEGDHRDERLREKLIEELPGILNWALSGYALWRAEGLGKPQAVLDATDSYRSQSDMIGQFIAERCVRAPHAYARMSQMYAAFSEWAKDAGERSYPKSRELRADLERRGFPVKARDGYPTCIGLGIRDLTREVTSE